MLSFKSAEWRMYCLVVPGGQAFDEVKKSFPDIEKILRFQNWLFYPKKDSFRFAKVITNASILKNFKRRHLFARQQDLFNWNEKNFEKKAC